MKKVTTSWRSWNIFSILTCLVTICSCSRYDGVRQEALDLARKGGDRQKYMAMRELVAGMDGRYSLKGESLDAYYDSLSNLYARQRVEIWDLRSMNDSIFADPLYFRDLTRLYDVEQVSAEYLLDRVDRALEVWRTSPLAEGTNFKDFCRYLLPYRVGNEELEDWFSVVESEYGHVLDSALAVPDITIRDFCLVLNTLIPKPHTYANYPSGMPNLKTSSLVNLVGGSCDNYVTLLMAIARYCGISVAVDFTPQWANHSKGHSWGAIIRNDSTYHYMLGEPAFYAPEKPFSYKLVKAYRKTHLDQTFLSQGVIDVSDHYGPVTDIRITGLFDGIKTRQVFLTCFDDKKWVPVAVSSRAGNSVAFEKTGYPAVFLPMYMPSSNLVPAQYPVLADSSGKMHYLRPDTLNRRTVRLTRKFMERRALQFVDSLKGGRFELASKPDFSDAVVMNIPEDISYNYQSIDLNGKKGRYLRFVPKRNGAGNIAEIELYDAQGAQLSAKVIGNYIPEDSKHPMEAAFDGNTLSYAACRKGQPEQWLGLDLGEEKTLSKLCYLPRSDDNFIREGQIYELCYWDKGGWVSLGTRVGSRETQELVYDNVPDGALLILHNHSAGKEERIFTYDYERDKQIWW